MCGVCCPGCSALCSSKRVQTLWLQDWLVATWQQKEGALFLALFKDCSAPDPPTSRATLSSTDAVMQYSPRHRHTQSVPQLLFSPTVFFLREKKNPSFDAIKNFTLRDMLTLLSLCCTQCSGGQRE